LHGGGARVQRGAAPCRDHHGRQRPLGDLPAPATGRRARQGGRGGTCDRGGLRAPRGRVPHAVRLQLRELAPAGRRGVGADAAVHFRARTRGDPAAEERHPASRDRRAVGLRAAASRADRTGRSAHRRQPSDDADRGRELRRTLGHPAGGPGGASRAAGARAASRTARRGGDRPPPRDGLCPGARPVHPHRRGAAGEQLPAVAARVYRALLHRRVLARLRRGGARPGHRVVRGAGAPVRAYQRTGHRGHAGLSLPPMLGKRVVTALVLLAILLPSIFVFSPWVWGAVTLVFLAIGAHEWSLLLGHRRSALAAAATLAGIGAALLAWHDLGGWPRWLVPLACGVATLLWVVIGPMRLRRHDARGGGWPLAAALLLACWIALLALRDIGAAALLSAMAIVWVADIAAYFVGRALGRRKLAPTISPGKSW